MSQSEQASELETLRSMVADLTARVERLEAESVSRTEEVTEDTILAISAAVAAYLGKRATIKQIRFASRDQSWASAGRSQIQQSHAIRPTR